MGTGILLLVFIAILAGRFSLDRLSASLPGLDLRIGFLYALVAIILLWVATGHRQIPKPVKVAGSGLFVAWAGWLAFSSAWAPPGARIEDKLLDVVLLAAFTLIAWGIMSRLPAEATVRIWKWMVIAALIYFVLAMAAGPGAQGRYAAPGGGPNVFVRVMVLGAIAALFYASEKKKMWPLLPIPLFAVGAALSGSRGGLVSAFVMLLVFAVPIARQLGVAKITAILFVAAVGGFVVANQNGGALVRLVQERYIQQTFVEGYSSGRDTITEDALRLYAERPIVGTGIDGYFALQEVPEQFEYPHNLFVATMAESGSIGLLLIVGALGSFVLAVRRSRPMPPSVLYSTGAGLYLAVASLFSGDYYDTRLMWFFFGLAVIEAARPKGEPSLATTKPEKAPRATRKTASVANHRRSPRAPRTQHRTAQRSLR